MSEQLVELLDGFNDQLKAIDTRLDRIEKAERGPQGDDRKKIEANTLKKIDTALGVLKAISTEVDGVRRTQEVLTSDFDQVRQSLPSRVAQNQKPAEGLQKEPRKLNWLELTGYGFLFSLTGAIILAGFFYSLPPQNQCVLANGSFTSADAKFNWCFWPKLETPQPLS